ncbi:hypothetical protein BDZ89DRAFT_1073124 [Hymenopellis radicata]|nr:hypothetical protein BDZ89DRAFT_1073124 [Hymenopellis radicata]
MTWRGFYANFVSYGQSPNSILNYFLEPEAQLVLLTIQRSFIALNGVIADLVNIWRCWVLYNRNWGVVVLPSLGIVSGLISHAFRTAVLFSHESGPSMWRITLKWLTVYCTVAASTNILTTSLIIYRILSVCGLKSARTYRGIMEVIIESALLYSATYAIYLALCLHDYYFVPYYSMASWYAEGFLNAVTAAAPTLIIWRFTAGEARLNDSWLHTLPHIDTAMQSTEIRVASINPGRTCPAHDDDSGPVQILLPEREEEGFRQSTDTLASTYDVEKGPATI